MISVAVVGGSGFIGSAIAKGLSVDGYEVSIFDIIPADDIKQCHYHYFDLTQPDIDQHIWQRFSAVIMAAGFLAKKCLSNPKEAWELNVVATTRLLDFLGKQKHPPQIIFLSSGMVYDIEKALPPFVENDPVKSHCLYTHSKIIIETKLSNAANDHQFSSLILRPFTVYGHGALAGERGHLFGRWIQLGREGKPITIYGDGTQIIDPVPVERIVQAISAYLALQKVPSVMTVNVTSGNRMTIRQLAELFVQTEIAPGITTMPETMADTRRGWGNADALRSLIGQDLLPGIKQEVTQFLGNFSKSMW